MKLDRWELILKEVRQMKKIILNFLIEILKGLGAKEVKKISKKS